MKDDRSMRARIPRWLTTRLTTLADVHAPPDIGVETVDVTVRTITVDVAFLEETVLRSMGQGYFVVSVWPAITARRYEFDEGQQQSRMTTHVTLLMQRVEP